MIPPPDFPPIEVELPVLSRLKELEEELLTQRKLFQAFQSWQEKIEFILEQQGCVLNDSQHSQQASPNFSNDSSTEGMKIISITSLSHGNSKSVAEEECVVEETIIPHNPTSLNLNESDNDMEIGISNGINFRPVTTFSSNNMGNTPRIGRDMDNSTVFPRIPVEPSSSTKLYVELPPVEYSNLTEEETETIVETNESCVKITASRSLRSNSNDRRVGRTASTAQKSVITSSNSNKLDSSGLVGSDSTTVLTQQRKARFAKDQEESLNHIEEFVSNGKRRYKCKLCSHVDNKETSVLTHIRMSHIGSERKYPCAYCSYRFKKATHLQQHVQLKHPGQPCELPSSLNIVLRREDDTFNIVKSGKKDKSLVAKRNHSIAFSSKSNTRMNGSLTRTQEDLEREIRSSYEIFRDNSVSSYLCIACGFLYDEEAMIRQHIIQTHKCAFCPEIFTSSSQLESHMSFCGTAGASSSKKVHALPSAHAITVGPGIQDADSDPSKKRRFSFPEEVRLEVDKYVSNIQNPRPPYICNICHLIIKSTRQSARIHVSSQHPDLLPGIQ